MSDYVDQGSGETGKKEIGASGDFGETEWNNLVSKTDLGVDSQGRLRLAEGGVIPQDGLYWHTSFYRNSYSDGDAISQIDDETGGGRPLTQTTTAAQPEYRTGSLNGQDAGYFDATDDSISVDSPLSDWQFLHSAKNTGFIVSELHGGAGSFNGIFGTTTIGGSRVGLTVAMDDRSGSGFNNTLRVGVNDGSGTDEIQVDNEIAVGTPYIISWRHDPAGDLIARVNGTQVGSVASSSNTASDPESTPVIGTFPGFGHYPVRGGSYAIYNVAKTDSEMSDIESSLDSIYGAGIL